MFMSINMFFGNFFINEMEAFGLLFQSIFFDNKLCRRLQENGKFQGSSFIKLPLIHIQKLNKNLKIPFCLKIFKCKLRSASNYVLQAPPREIVKGT